MTPLARAITVAIDMSKACDTINIHTLIRKLLQTNIPGTIIKLIANYIKGRKAYTTYRNHTSIQRQFKAVVPVASSHPHYSTYTLQTNHHQEHQFRSWPTQMTSPSHLHTQARVQPGNTYNHTYIQFLPGQTITTSHFKHVREKWGLGGPMCFRCLMFILSRPCELIFLLCFIASWTWVVVSLMLNTFMFCVSLLIDLFVLCVVCLIGIVNCLVKQFSIYLGVVDILLLYVMELINVVGGRLLDRPCMVLQRMCVLCLCSQWACRCSFHMFCLYFCISEVISSFRSLRAGSQMFALLMFSHYVLGQEPAVAVHIALWYVVLVCHQYDVCENYVGSVYIDGYGDLSESGLCVFRKVCLVSFLVVGDSPSVLF